MKHFHLVWLIAGCASLAMCNGVLHTNSQQPHGGVGGGGGDGYAYVSPATAPAASAPVAGATFPYAFERPQLSNFAQFSLGGAPLYQHVRPQPAFGVAVAQPQDARNEQRLEHAPQYFVPQAAAADEQQHQQQQQQQQLANFKEQPTFFVPRYRPAPTSAGAHSAPSSASSASTTLTAVDCAPQLTLASAPSPQHNANRPSYNYVSDGGVVHESRAHTSTSTYPTYPTYASAHSTAPRVPSHGGFFQPAAGVEREAAASLGQIGEANKKQQQQLQSLQQQHVPQQQQQQQLQSLQHEQQQPEIAIQYFRPASYVASKQQQQQHNTVTGAQQQPQQQPQPQPQSQSPSTFQFPEQRQQQQFSAPSYSVYPSQQLSVSVPQTITGDNSLYHTQQSYHVPAQYDGYYQSTPATAQSQSQHINGGQLDATPAYAAGHKGLGHYQYALNKPIAAIEPQSQQTHQLAHQLPQQYHRQQPQPQQQQQQQQQLQPQPQHLQLSAGYSGPAAAAAAAVSSPSSYLQMQSHSYELTPTATQQRQPHTLYGTTAGAGINGATTTITTSTVNSAVSHAPATAPVPQYGGFRPTNYLK